MNGALNNTFLRNRINESENVDVLLILFDFWGRLVWEWFYIPDRWWYLPVIFRLVHYRWIILYNPPHREHVQRRVKSLYSSVCNPRRWRPWLAVGGTLLRLIRFRGFRPLYSKDMWWWRGAVWRIKTWALGASCGTNYLI